MKHLCLAAAMLIATAAAAAQDNPDQGFYVQAAQLGLAEVECGLLAQQHGKSPDVTGFGALMVKDHGAANARLRQLAAGNDVELPAAPTAEQASKIKQLSMLSGDDFDRSYIETQILAHRNTVALFKMESESGDDKEAREFASDTLPTLQMHLTQLLTMPMIPPPPVTQ